MSVQPVADAEDIIRYVPPRLVNEDGSIDGAAFLPRVADHDGSSVHRMSVYADEKSDSLTEIKARFRLKRSVNGRFAEVNAGQIKECATELRQVGLILVIEDPLPEDVAFAEDPAHALVTGLPTRGIMDELIVLHINKRISAVYPAS